MPHRLTDREIPGHFGPGHQMLYETVIRGAKPGFVLIEVGSFQGKSICFAAQLLQQLGKRIRLVAVDDFIVRPDYISQLDGRDLRVAFDDHLRRAGVAHLVEVMPTSSTDAATQWAPRSVDFVFIDASHDYESVRADIQAWGPTLAPDGLLAGDDYALDTPGVIRAVQELVVPHYVHGRIWSASPWIR